MGDLPVDEGTLGVHEVELVVQAREDLGHSGGVGDHAHGALHLHAKRTSVESMDGDCCRVHGRIGKVETRWAPGSEQEGERWQWSKAGQTEHGKGGEGENAIPWPGRHRGRRWGAGS